MHAKTAFTGPLLCLALTASASAQSASREILISPLGGSPSVAATGEGNFVVAWQEQHAGSDNDVFVQYFNGDGRPALPVLTAAGGFGDQLYPRVAADARGNFALVWQGGSEVRSPGFPGGDGQRTGVFLQRFDQRGHRVGPARIVNRLTGGFQTHPAVAMRLDGSFMIAWDHFVPGGVGEVHAQAFSPSGVRRGGELEMNLVKQSAFPKNPAVAVEGEGFAIGWTETESCAGIEQIPVIARFEASGRPLAPSFRLTDGDCDGSGWFLRGLAGGESGSAALFRGLRNSVQLFGPSGEPAGLRKVIGERNLCAGGLCETVLAVAMDNAGRFAVVWALALDVPSSSEGDRFPPRYTLLAQVFDPQGQPLGERFPVTGALSRFEPTVAAALSDEGSLIVVWNRNAAAPEKSGLFLRQFTID